MKTSLLVVLLGAAALSLSAGLAPASALWVDQGAGQVLCAVASDLQEADYAALLKDSKVSLAEGIRTGLAEAKEGVVVKAELEGDATTHWAVDVSKGDKLLAVDVDVKTGKVLASEVENEDRSKLAQTAKITILKAIEIALEKTPGQAVRASLTMAGDKPRYDIAILAKEKLKTLQVDAVSGKVAAKKLKKEAQAVKAFTDHFPVEPGDWASSGRNEYFILEPGYSMVFEGKEDGKDVRMTIDVLKETRVIDGVETRVVVDKVYMNGKLEEDTRDYFAFSKKTASVYYFGEDVDNYKDGKIDNHKGSWLSGVNGAKYGLQMPGLALVGARFFQELAPGAGMDRIEILSLSEKVETPAGKFEHCLKTEETSPLEPGVVESKLYAPGVGLLQEGDVKLVKYGMSGAK